MNNDLTRFLNAEIECLKDELAHLQVKHAGQFPTEAYPEFNYENYDYKG